MENSTYSKRMLKYWDKVKMSSRSTETKAYVAHIFGVISEFHYASIFSSEYDGPGAFGQNLSIDVEAKCLEVLNAFMITHEQMAALESGVMAMIRWMQACDA